MLSTLVTGPTLAQRSQSVRDRSAAREITSYVEAAQEDEDSEGLEESRHIMARAEQFSAARTAPGTAVSAKAYAAARAAAARLPKVGGTWDEVTNQVYQNESPVYRDPVFSNSGAGWFEVSGRMVTIASARGAIFAGAADGGVWKTTDGGKHWRPWSKGLPRLSIGDMARASDGSLWAGLGEANTAQDNFEGEGVFRLPPGGDTWERVGGDELLSSLTYRVFFARRLVFVATNRACSGATPTI